jgi:anti-anti-sigma regulatory factor
MFRAEIQWLAIGPTLKLEGQLVAGWAEQAECLVTKDVLPKGLIVDLAEVSYIDSVGEQLLKWLASATHCLSPAMSMQLPYATGWVYRPCRRCPNDASGGM